MSNRIPNLAPPFSKTRNKIVSILSRPFKKLSDTQKFWIGFVVLTVLTTLLLQSPFRQAFNETYKEGEIMRQSIVSPADISVVNTEETEAIKQSSREAIRPIFTFESNRAEQAVQSFRISWEKLTKVSPNSNSNVKSNSKTDDTQWTGTGGIEVEKILSARRFTPNEIDAVIRALKESAEGSIYDDADKQYFQNEITLLDRQKPNQQSIASLPESSMTPLSSARRKLFERLTEIKTFSPKEIEAFNKALETFVQASVTFDSVATNMAREAAAQSIQPVSINLKRGQIVARSGDTVTPNILSQINAIQIYSSSTRQLNRFIGLLLLIGAFYWIAWKYIEQRGLVLRLTLSPELTFALFGFVIIIQMLLLNAGFLLADFTAAQNLRPPFTDSAIWSFAIPFAFSSLLITLLADRRTALFAGLFASFLGGMLATKGLEFIIYSTISSAVAVYGIGHYRSRQSVTTAGLLIGLVNILTTIALIAYTQQPFILNTILLAIGCGLLGGLITSAVTAVFLPICESLFGILTDVKLLELSNADLPILGQLALRAPGTNQHSHAVGQLTEEACRAVGANGLLARIGALYHDIGKTAAPEHFVENQLGKNPHDKLKPVQSAKIIISHVTYGIKLGKEIGLPQRIIDFIPQHHGTRTLHFFLRKAQAEANETVEIDEQDFRYPGPKPQFKEAAIMMIADSCEAAARALQEPTPENIRYIVTKIIDAILSDDQLDECDLTLRELTLIREAMIRSLVAIYHSRVDYPGFIPPNSQQKIVIPNELLDSEERGIKYSNPEDIPLSKGGEIEDEAINRSRRANSKADAQSSK